MKYPPHFRPAPRAAAFLGALVGILVSGLAFSGAAAAQPEPDLSTLDTLSQERIQERQAWHRRLVRLPSLPAKDRAAAWGELGTLFHAYGLQQAAAESYAEAAKLLPQDPRWPYLQSQLAAADGLSAQQLDDPRMSKVVALGPGTLEQMKQADGALSSGDLAAAIKALGGTLAADPLWTLPRMLLAGALMRADQPIEAGKQLETVLKISPYHSRAHGQLGFLLAQGGEKEAAVGHYQMAVDGAPNNHRARASLARLLRDLGRHEEALRELAELAKTTPEDVPIRLEEAGELVHLGRHGEARLRLMDALALLPDDPELANALARLLATAPQPAVRDGDQAVSLATALLQTSPAPRYATTLAMALAETGQYDRAAALQRKILEQVETTSATDLAARLRANLESYQNGRPIRIPGDSP